MYQNDAPGRRQSNQLLSFQVSSIREDFNDLLTALPEGTVAGIPASPASQGSQVGASCCNPAVYYIPVMFVGLFIT